MKMNGFTNLTFSIKSDRFVISKIITMISQSFIFYPLLYIYTMKIQTPNPEQSFIRSSNNRYNTFPLKRALKDINRPPQQSMASETHLKQGRLTYRPEDLNLGVSVYRQNQMLKNTKLSEKRLKPQLNMTPTQRHIYKYNTYQDGLPKSGQLYETQTTKESLQDIYNGLLLKYNHYLTIGENQNALLIQQKLSEFIRENSSVQEAILKKQIEESKKQIEATIRNLVRSGNIQEAGELETKYHRESEVKIHDITTPDPTMETIEAYEEYQHYGPHNSSPASSISSTPTPLPTPQGPQLTSTLADNYDISNPQPFPVPPPLPIVQNEINNMVMESKEERKEVKKEVARQSLLDQIKERKKLKPVVIEEKKEPINELAVKLAEIRKSVVKEDDNKSDGSDDDPEWDDVVSPQNFQVNVDGSIKNAKNINQGSGLPKFINYFKSGKKFKFEGSGIKTTTLNTMESSLSGIGATPEEDNAKRIIQFLRTPHTKQERDDFIQSL